MGGCNSGMDVTRQPRVFWPVPQKKHMPATVTLAEKLTGSSGKLTVLLNGQNIKSPSTFPHQHLCHSQPSSETLCVQLTLVNLQPTDQCVKNECLAMKGRLVSHPPQSSGTAVEEGVELF